MGWLWLGLAAVVSAGDRVEEVVAAVRFAYGLEAEVWRDPARFRTRAAIYEHFRQGFSPDLASAMTEHVLTGDGDLATWVPAQVQVAELLPSFALVWFPTPPAFGEGGLWGLESYMQLKLRRDGGRWVVYEGTDRPAPPVR
jgi:hypothetical protein